MAFRCLKVIPLNVVSLSHVLNGSRLLNDRSIFCFLSQKKQRYTNCAVILISNSFELFVLNLNYVGCHVLLIKVIQTYQIILRPRQRWSKDKRLLLIGPIECWRSVWQPMQSHYEGRRHTEKVE